MDVNFDTVKFMTSPIEESEEMLSILRESSQQDYLIHKLYQARYLADNWKFKEGNSCELETCNGYYSATISHIDKTIKIETNKLYSKRQMSTDRVKEVTWKIASVVGILVALVLGYSLLAYVSYEFGFHTTFRG